MTVLELKNYLNELPDEAEVTTVSANTDNVMTDYDPISGIIFTHSIVDGKKMICLMPQ